MSRNGKIARLPGTIREQINQRLQNGENGREVIAWLNANDEVKAVLAAEFGGHDITDDNLSQWRQGGYRDWERQQEALAETHRLVSEGLELNQAGENRLADSVATWLLGQYVMVTRKLLENDNDEAAWKLLRELCHDVVALRRGEHGAEWLRLEQERLKLRQQKQESDREKLKAEILKENPPPEVLSEEEKEERWREIFGMLPTPKKNPFESEPEPSPEDTVEQNVRSSEPGPGAGDPTDLEPPNRVGARSGLGTEGPIESRPVADEQTEPEEFKRLKARAELGDAYSAYCLGANYRDGFGVAKDFAKARAWLEKAASQGLGAAKVELHVMLMHPFFQT